MNNSLELKVDQGVTWRRALTISDDQGNPIDLTGHSFKAQVRINYADKSPLFSFSFSVIDAANGKVDMLLPANFYLNPLSSTLVCVYDCDMIYPGGEVERLFGGKLILYPGANR